MSGFSLKESFWLVVQNRSCIYLSNADKYPFFPSQFSQMKRYKFLESSLGDNFIKKKKKLPTVSQIHPDSKKNPCIIFGKYKSHREIIFSSQMTPARTRNKTLGSTYSALQGWNKIIIEICVEFECRKYVLIHL